MRTTRTIKRRVRSFKSLLTFKIPSRPYELIKQLTPKAFFAPCASQKFGRHSEAKATPSLSSLPISFSLSKSLRKHNSMLFISLRKTMCISLFNLKRMEWRAYLPKSMDFLRLAFEGRFQNAL